MSRITSGVVGAHHAAFGAISRGLNGWLPGLAARMIFASVLLFYFWKSALTKVGEGPFGFLMPSDGAYIQILPQLVEQVGYDTSQIEFFPYGLIVLLGTWAEFVLPLLITVGLFTRLASAGFIGFIAVMTFVDITGHHVDATAIGAFFDAKPDSPIADQRLLWVFPLLYLVLRGAGVVSLDWLLARAWHRRPSAHYI